MADRYVFEYTLTREDWLSANRALIAMSPQYAAFARQQQRAAIKRMAWIGPLIIVGASLGIGRSESTHGMYLEGALAGWALVVLMCLAFCRRSVYMANAKRQAEQKVQRMELGAAVGRIRVEVDEAGVATRTAGAENRTAWKYVVVHAVGDYFVVTRGGGGMIIPRSVVGDEAAGKEFGERCAEWWKLGQQSAGERIAAYLAGRDVACPKCGYNLRGVAGERCPECGDWLSMEGLSRARQG